ncbi:S66 family peptidase [Novisyntrophococcus fermenticellae]|uniref:S66 family peptidase n=1 Tax=Novisyntrophococcus fermenticellae TaxID=2068655 RepID=UPI001E60F895|nr:S66 peptidase family protein [Novisyntrophococcus fermenticellae]
MRYPEFLKNGGTIGFVAPSFGCQTEPYRTAFQNAQSKLEKEGYRLQLGPNCYEGRGTGISNTPKLCGDEFTEQYCAKTSDVLISCGGGELMCEILDYVDFNRVNNTEPKWFMGYSDNTNLTFLLPTICDVAAIYGPCAPAFGMDPWHPAIWDALRLLGGKKLKITGYDSWERESGKDEEHPLEPYHVSEPKILKCFPETKHVKFEGRLLGGCMDCLVNLTGTKYDHVKKFNERYQEEGVIWFLESCDLNVVGIRRAIWQMIHAGWFEHPKGFLIGRPYCFGQEMFGLDQYRAVYELLEPFQVPIVMDVDLGHLPPMLPVISGGYAAIEIRDNNLTIDMQMK